jgi:hypothetical protein
VTEKLQLADLLGALSMVADLGFGLPSGPPFAPVW